jgi:hypothetical protein
MKNLILPFLMLVSFNCFAEDLSYLKNAQFSRMSGEAINFEEVEIFACRNIVNNRFLMNKKMTDHCWIKNSTDAGIIAGKLGGKYWGPNTVFFQSCPKVMATEKNCDPSKLRDF